MSGKVTLSIRITEELDEWVRDEARLWERTVGQIVEASLRDTRARYGQPYDYPSHRDGS